MTRLHEQAARQRLLWLDHLAYSARLLAGGRYPWLDTAACTALLRQAHGLLRSDVLLLPLAELAAAWLEHDAGLRDAMAAKSRRPHGPLKELLASPGLRAQAQALATALRAVAPAALLALVLPSPRDWVALTASGSPAAAEVDEDAVDAAALCMADFLRGFASVGIDALLLRESSPVTSAEAELWLELTRPVANVAQHYGWAWGLQSAQALELPEGAPERFVIAPSPAACGLCGVMVGTDFWRSGVAPPSVAGRFDAAEIPVDTAPETVLARLTQLRGR